MDVKVDQTKSSMREKEMKMRQEKSSIGGEEPDATIGRPGSEEPQGHREFAAATEFREGTEEIM